MDDQLQPGVYAIPENQMRWPKPIGVISIVFGSLGIVTGMFAFFASKFTTAMFRLSSGLDGGGIDSEALQNFEQTSSKWSWFSYLSGSIFIVASVFLLLCGIACVKNKKSCRPKALVYFVLNIVYIVLLVWAVFGTSMLLEQTEATQAMSPTPIPLETQTMISKVTTLLTGVFYLIYPLFLFFWFYARKSVKRDVAEQFS